jgi:opacity protein-like surface antigen
MSTLTGHFDFFRTAVHVGGMSWRCAKRAACRSTAMKALKVLSLVVAIGTLSVAPSTAQERGSDPAGYVSAFGAAAWADGSSTGSLLFEGGVRIMPHLMAFANVGRFANLQGDLQPSLTATTTTLSNQGLSVTGGGTLPAWYGVGGLRAEIPAGAHVIPYVLGGLGVARLNPTAQFTYASGTMPDGSIPAVGTNVTSTLVSTGSYVAPAASSAFMLMLGGGVQIPVVPRWAADVGYRYSHIAADSTLSASPLNTNAITFGVGYRF